MALWTNWPAPTHSKNAQKASDNSRFPPQGIQLRLLTFAAGLLGNIVEIVAKMAAAEADEAEFVSDTPSAHKLQPFVTLEGMQA
jgi:hypothetical protein